MIFEILQILTVTVPLKPSRFRFSQLSKLKVMMEENAAIYGMLYAHV